MSLLGAMNTAISGLNGQSAAFSNISDNVANSQTVGYKEVNTAFIDYLSVSNATENQSGSVVTIPEYQNNVQGTLSQTSDPLGMAISGQGFFPVSVATSTSGGQTTFSTTPAYTRAGDFQLNAQGYLVNSAGNYLNGWPVNSTTGVVNTNSLAPIQVTQTIYNPVPTSTISLSANLPATPSSTTPVSSQVTVYDSLGTAHTVTLNWTQNATNDWTVSINAPDDVSTPAEGTADVQFGSTSGNGVPAGTVGALGTATGNVSTTSYAAGSAANISFTANFGQGPQQITLNLGNFGASTGLTQYAGSTYTLNGISQDGVPPGSYSSITAAASGAISVNYSNGQSRVVAQVPVVTFSSPDSLQSQNGQAYTASSTSGNPIANAAGSNGSGTLVVGSIEQSNVDIAQQFSALIVAQEAYSANTKVVTTADQLMQSTINMKQ
ncbi:MAG: flagellar hook protein FlgE [Acetobacteraceae bacterium]|nr:flagellar hook protein FlgE [Acetobacteraceae bacterium]